MVRPLRAVLTALAVTTVVTAAPDAHAQQQRLEPPARRMRRPPENPCEPGSVLAFARAARDAVDRKNPDAARLRVQAYNDAFLRRVGACLDERLAWAASAKSGPTTWARAQATLSDYFFQLWRGGALVGTQPEHAYLARCDRTTMTQADIDAGLLVCTYGLALLRPAEHEPGVVRLSTSGKEPGLMP